MYEGTFKDGRREGRGKIVFPDGNSYEGDFERGIPHGMGKFKNENGDIYTGKVVNSRREG